MTGLKKLLRRCQGWLSARRRQPASADLELVEALRQLAREADRLEAQLRQLTDKRQAQARPTGRPALRVVEGGKQAQAPDSFKQR